MITYYIYTQHALMAYYLHITCVEIVTSHNTYKIDLINISVVKTFYLFIKFYIFTDIIE
jgi:hypothetical protein